MNEWALESIGLIALETRLGAMVNQETSRISKVNEQSELNRIESNSCLHTLATERFLPIHLRLRHPTVNLALLANSWVQKSIESL